MAHNYQKKWVFTWNSNDLNGSGLPAIDKLIALLDEISKEGVFQMEAGSKADRPHYQGRFVLLGPRTGKKKLLEIFGKLGEIKNLTFEPERVYDSSNYCTKTETRLMGPWYVGLTSYKQEKKRVDLKLKPWQKDLSEIMFGPESSKIRKRKVLWVQDPLGGSGKSTFLKYLSTGPRRDTVEKLPIDKPDRVRMAVCKIAKQRNTDVYAFDFSRTMAEDSSFKDLFNVIEELKNGHVVSLMYGTPMKAFLDDPMVLIFTNESISRYYHYLSKDRWVPFEIKDEKLYYIPNTGGDYHPSLEELIPASDQFDLGKELN